MPETLSNDASPANKPITAGSVKIAMNRSIPPAWTYDKLGVDYSSNIGSYNRDIPRFNTSDLWESYQREGLLQRIIDREAQKIFSKWFQILTPGNHDSDLPEQVQSAMSEYGMRHILPQWHRSRMLFGCGWLMHQLSGVETSSDLEKPPSPNAKYLGIMPFSKNEWLETKRISDFNRNVAYYSFKVGSCNTQNSKEISSANVTSIWNVHPDRLILNKNDPFGIHPEGISEVIGGMAHLDELRNILFMLEMGLHNRCFSIPILEYPDNMDDTLLASIEEKLRLFNFLDSVSIPKGPNEQQNLKISFNNSFSEIGNIEPLIELVLKVFSTTVGLPYALLFGTPAGGLSGSEMNSREYLSGLSAKLKLEYTPLIRKLIEDWRKFGVIKNTSDEYDILFPPLYEMTDEEEKKVLFLESNRAMNFHNMRKEFSMLANGFIDNNSLAGPIEVAEEEVKTKAVGLRSPDLRNPDDEAQALMNASTYDELVVAVSNMRKTVDAVQSNLDYVRNELAVVQ